MTPDQIRLVQDSFAKIRPNAAAAADLFYGRMFSTEPQVRPLFPEDMTEQKKKLMTMLGTAVAGLSEIEAILPAVQELGRRHVAYGVEPAQYDIVGSTLLWTLEQGLGDAFTPEVKAAWTDTYNLLAKVMLDAAAEVEGPAHHGATGTA